VRPMKLDRQVIYVNSRGMGFLKPTRSKIALIIIYSIIVLGMVGYILGGRAGKHTSSNIQQESLQEIPITSLQSSITKLPTSTPTIIRSEAAKVPTATPIIASPCSARDIRATVFWHASTGTLLGEIMFRNTASSPCSLLGFPLVQLKDESGFLYQTQVAHYTHLYDQYSTDKPVAVILQPGTTTAQDSFAWGGCVPSPKGSILVFITLPYDTTQLLAQAVDGSGNITKQVDTPRCSVNITPVNQSSLDVGSFELFQG